MSQPSTEPITTPAPPAGQGPTGTPAAPAQPGATEVPTGWDGPFDAARAKAAIEAGRREAAELREKARKFDEAERAKLSELDQHRNTATTERARADAAELTIARLKAGLAHGLTEAQASRLTGTTPEEILADGAAFAQELGITKADPAAAPGGETPPEKDITGNRSRPTQQPVVTPRGGTDPSSEPEPDLEKIASEIPR